MQAILRVAPPYDQAEIDLIRQGFEAQLGKTIEFYVMEDPSLIGGFFAQIDGTVYDFSYSTQLGNMYRQILEQWGGEDDAAI